MLLVCGPNPFTSVSIFPAAALGCSGSQMPALQKIALGGWKIPLYLPIAFSQGGTKTSHFTSRKDNLFWWYLGCWVPLWDQAEARYKAVTTLFFPTIPASFIFFLLRAHLNKSCELNFALKLGGVSCLCLELCSLGITREWEWLIP